MRLTGSMIRFADAHDFAAMTEIERAAGEAFREIAMDAIADDEPASFTELAISLDKGPSWVSVDDAARVIAYLVSFPMDDRLFIEQVTVHPSNARRGLGAELLATASAWAGDRELRGVILTTFEHVPWNAPYYERLGFEIVAEGKWSAALQLRVRAEAARGLDAWPRVVMVRD
jgi:GNAT superfamily N-acetyltransferase